MEASGRICHPRYLTLQEDTKPSRTPIAILDLVLWFGVLQGLLQHTLKNTRRDSEACMAHHRSRSLGEILR